MARGCAAAATSGRLGGLSATPIASTQSPQDSVAPIDGVYWEVPLRGVAWFNSHAFNLQDADTLLEVRVNLYFADKREQMMRSVPNTANIFIAAGQPPFTRKSYCAKAVVPQGYSISSLSSHTHRRGEHFWVKDQAGKQIYESFTYNDPLVLRFDDWLKFDSADPAQRTLVLRDVQQRSDPRRPAGPPPGDARLDHAGTHPLHAGRVRGRQGRVSLRETQRLRQLPRPRRRQLRCLRDQGGADHRERDVRADAALRAAAKMTHAPRT